MRKYAYLVTASMIGLGLSNTAAAGTASINGGPCFSYTSLASAISAASSGDTIWVEGIHNVNELEVSKDLTFNGVTSSGACYAGDPAGIISNGTTRVMHIRASTVLIRGIKVNGGNGFSTTPATTGKGGTIYLDESRLSLYDSDITNGATSDGGCVYGYNSTLSLIESTIYHCMAYNNGGGVYLENASADLTYNSTVSDNTATFAGGGLFVDGSGQTALSNPLYVDGTSSVIDNTAEDGGGLYLQGPGATLNLEGELSDNTAYDYGGGAYLAESTFNSTPGSRIWNNDAWIGGAVAMNDSRADITGGQYVQNTASYGGAIALRNKSKLHVEPTSDCYAHVNPTPSTLCMGFVQNQSSGGSSGGGSAIFARDSEVYADHTYFYMNYATDDAAAIDVANHSTLALYDSFVLANQTSSGTGRAIYIKDSVGNIEGNTVADNTGRGVVYNSSTGVFDGNIVYDNTSTAPQVVLGSATSLTNCNAAQNVTAAWAISANPSFGLDYSPTNALMIDACSSYGGTGLDIDGTPRITGAYDMGAVEQ